MPISDNDLQYPDYTMSQPISAPVFSQDFMKEAMEMNIREFSF